MQVSNSYYEDEVRDGFFVPGMMKRAWAAQIEVLEEVAKVCSKYNIRYFADAGTLLGAVRHRGFIPWDDDLDICMMRADYDLFLKVAKDELPKEYGVLNIHTEPEYGEMFCRVVNSRKGISFEAEHLKKYHEFPFVVGIDIFPLDCIAPDIEQEKKRCNMVNIVSRAVAAIECGNRPDEDKLRHIEKQLNVIIDRKGNLKNQLLMLTERLFTMYNGLQGAEEIALMPVWVQYGSNKFRKEWYRDVLMLPFENIEVQVPAMYDAILKEKYGDYMRIVKIGGCHDYPFYKQQEETLLDVTGIKLEPEYTFSMDDLNRERPEEKKTIKDLAENGIYLLKQTHAEFKKALDNKEIIKAAELLEGCQNTAISIGTSIEESQGEECKIVGMLERYCEIVYCMYEELSRNNETILNEVHTDKIYTELQEMLSAIENRVLNDIKVRREIVFLPYKATMWCDIENLWRAAKEEPDCDVYVIPIPYFHKKWDGNFGDMEYEGTGYPQEVSVVRYEDYDFAKRKPDVIFIQNPYDEYNHEVSVHPFFYSRNLVRFTKNLIYVADFTLDDKDLDKPRVIESMKHFITVPGVACADKVVVKSEKMRRAYIDTLAKFAGEDTVRLWEQKIIGFDSPVFDKVEKYQKKALEIPQEWLPNIQKPDGSRKKVILYNTSVSTLLQYGERMLHKICNVLEVFQNNQNEVTLLWRPHPLSESALESTRPQLLPEYEKLVQYICTSEWGIYDDSADGKCAVEICDAYYGDGERELLLCMQEGKPVMLQNVEILC